MSECPYTQIEVYKPSAPEMAESKRTYESIEEASIKLIPIVQEIYDGKYKNGKYHGKGTLKYPELGLKFHGYFENGNKYEGVWYRNGVQHKSKYEYGGSICILTREGKITYKGELLYDLPHGKGTYYKGKTHFVGHFENKKFVKGEIITNKKVTHTGTFVDNKLHGDDCTEILPNGYTCQGKFENGVFKSGTYNNGKEYYEGNFIKKDGENSYLCHGNGSFHTINSYFPNNVTYEGDYVKGEFHGKGTYNKSGIICTGKFVNNSLYKGKIVWKKITFIGKFKKIINKSYNYSNAYNVFLNDSNGVIIENKRVYIGNVEKDEKHGYGAEYINKKLVKCGHWENGIFDENTSRRGTYYDGEFADDMYTRHGKGILYKNGSVLMKGKWENGEFVEGERFEHVFDSLHKKEEKNNTKMYDENNTICGFGRFFNDKFSGFRFLHLLEHTHVFFFLNGEFIKEMEEDELIFKRLVKEDFESLKF